jgi:predicted amidohydrolase
MNALAPRERSRLDLADRRGFNPAKVTRPRRTTMTFRIAIVQPISHPPGEDERNVADAVRAIERAAGEGAAFICFPETYPGPWRMPGSFDPTAAMAEAAATYGVHVVFGTIEPIDRKAATAHNLIVMAYPDGRAPARYRRTHPNGPWIYTGGPAWEFQYVPGNDFPVFDTVHGKVGLAMCSEVYMPEVARALALRGAEFIFMPAGKDKNRLWATWRTLIWARAIENLALVVTTQNLFHHGERGLAMVAAPEEIVFESTAAGMSVVDLSLDRVRFLRATRDEVGSSAGCATKQGLLGPQWQRPELYGSFYPPPLREAAE